MDASPPLAVRAKRLDCVQDRGARPVYLHHLSRERKHVLGLTAEIMVWGSAPLGCRVGGDLGAEQPSVRNRVLESVGSEHEKGKGIGPQGKTEHGMEGVMVECPTSRVEGEGKGRTDKRVGVKGRETDRKG
jgi:hypothetical protein